MPQQPAITAITLAELSVGPLVTADATERATRQARLQQAGADFDPFPFDAAAARAVGRVAAFLRQAGWKTNARACDAMIAAIAISNDLPLYTCNSADCEHIDGLDLRPVPHPDEAGALSRSRLRNVGNLAGVTPDPSTGSVYRTARRL